MRRVEVMFDNDYTGPPMLYHLDPKHVKLVEHKEAPFRSADEAMASLRYVPRRLGKLNLPEQDD